MANAKRKNEHLAVVIAGVLALVAAFYLGEKQKVGVAAIVPNPSTKPALPMVAPSSTNSPAAPQATAAPSTMQNILKQAGILVVTPLFPEIAPALAV